MSSILDALSRNEEKARGRPARQPTPLRPWMQDPPTRRRRDSMLWLMALVAVLAGGLVAAGSMVAVLSFNRGSGLAGGWSPAPPPVAARYLVVLADSPTPTHTLRPVPTMTPRPTRPVATLPPAAAAPAQEPAFDLTGTLGSGPGGVAIINGNAVRTGDLVGGQYRVIEIGDGWVRCAGWPEKIYIK